MTEYFEVTHRDGPARLGTLRLEDPVTTPCVAEEILVDGGSKWPADQALPEGRNDRLTILPHRAFPAGTDDRVQDAFKPEYPSVDYPSAAVVSPETAGPHGTDAYVLSGVQRLSGHARAFVEAITHVRDTVPPDTALYLSGIATPLNVATLVYAGVDLIDDDRAVIAGSQGRYLTRDGNYPLDALDELPCHCPACTSDIESFTREDCVAHNQAILDDAVTTVRQRIRMGRLRDYLEGQARHSQWCTAALRELDDRWAYLEPRTPLVRRAEITAATDDTLRRVEIRRFADRVTARYTNRFDRPLVLLPCSARKPYSSSQSHKQFADAINYRGHIVSMTSPIGIVPQELELTYPAQHYDAVVTGRWTATEKEFVASVLDRYLDRNTYSRIIAHVPPEGYREIVEQAVATRSVPVEFTVTAHPTTDESLAALSEALTGESQYAQETRAENTIRAIADYQFGENAGDRLFDAPAIKGQYPKFQVFENDEQLATLVPEYGVLAFTLEGARRLESRDITTPVVEIDDFVPHGSVLAPGITNAAESIRIGDDVVITGPSAFGVGRAQMTGPEMTASTRGIAVDMRHVTDDAA